MFTIIIYIRMCARVKDERGIVGLYSKRSDIVPNITRSYRVYVCCTLSTRKIKKKKKKTWRGQINPALCVPPSLAGFELVYCCLLFFNFSWWIVVPGDTYSIIRVFRVLFIRFFTFSHSITPTGKSPVSLNINAMTQEYFLPGRNLYKKILSSSNR